MRGFEDVVALAASRRGGMVALEEELAKTRSSPVAVIAATPDDRVLSAMTRRVFQAGFSWKVIDAKWDGFEAAFDGFDPNLCAFMSDAQFDALLKDTRIIRNGAKIRSVITNGRLIVDLAGAHGSAARFFAEWPDSNYIGLLDLLKKRGSRLGVEAAMRFLRSIGKPAFIPTRDVVAALLREGVLDRESSGRRDFAVMQEAFNKWSADSGRDLTELSRILAMSVG
jgi:3-methyladenine DNA glycosylase Tag